MANPIQAPKGTVDILPEEAARWRRVEDAARKVLARYGYGEIRTPIFESTEVFQRGIGEHTDIVGKEMYSFMDRGERSLTLRPENTAGVARAYVQHKMQALPSPRKLWYLGPMFRAERPQKGRQRQFWQLGTECMGTDAPRYDAEAIVLATDFLAEVGLTGLETQLNSVGCSTCRPAYRETLQAYLRAHAEALCTDCVERTEKNPLRVLDCKVPGCQPVIAAAPSMADSLCEVCVASLAEVTSLLDAAGVAWTREPRLVRGLDYYTRTVFEIVAAAGQGLGSQSTVCAGGRYNGLVSELGGPDTPSVGWGLGMERLLILLEAQEARAIPPSCSVIVTSPGTPAAPVFAYARELRKAGLVVEMAPPGKLDKQFKFADRLGASHALVLGESELDAGTVTVKELASGRQYSLSRQDVLAAEEFPRA